MQMPTVWPGKRDAASRKMVWMNWRCPTGSPLATQRICPLRIACIASYPSIVHLSDRLISREFGLDRRVSRADDNQFSGSPDLGS